MGNQVRKKHIHLRLWKRARLLFQTPTPPYPQVIEECEKISSKKPSDVSWVFGIKIHAGMMSYLGFLHGPCMISASGLAGRKMEIIKTKLLKSYALC